MSDLVIETEGLRKTFGHKVAVADLTLQVRRGEVFGFLGPNGAGKSTSLKMLLSLVTPDGGSARVLGHPPGDLATKAKLGFLPEHFRFHEWLQARELLDLHGRLYGMRKAERARRIPDVLELVGLTEHARRPISGFSKGMLQRIGLAQALLNDPELVFLDEPTSGLDPFGRMLVRSIIRDLRSRGTSVFLNSHMLGDVESVCDRVSFIRDGVVLRTLPLSDMNKGNLHVELCVDVVSPHLLRSLDEVVVSRHFVEGETGGAEITAAGASGAAAIATVAAGLATATTLELVIDDEEQLPAIAQRVQSAGARLYALTPKRISLEQLFLDVVGNEDSGQ